VRKKPARRKLKPEPESEFVRQLDFDDDDVLTVTDAAELFGISTQTNRRWAELGTLPSFRTIGGHRRFRWGEIRRVVA
jgi:excisionase family DNA binding protein